MLLRVICFVATFFAAIAGAICIMVCFAILLDFLSWIGPYLGDFVDRIRDACLAKEAKPNG